MVTLPDAPNQLLGYCPACGSATWIPAGKVKDDSVTGEWFDLMECSICHLRASTPTPAPSEIGRYYASEEYISHSDSRNGLINRIYHAVRTYMLKRKKSWVIKACDKEKGNLLEVGAGTGHFAHFMQSHGWTVTALEPDEKARQLGAEKLAMQMQPMNILDYLPSNSYDVITLWHVLEHVHDPAHYISRFRELLKPGGALIIAVPNYTSKDETIYKTSWAAYDVPRHLWHFSPSSMEKLLQKHQFTLTGKIPMHLDAFYVSMLSEKYRGHSFLATLLGSISGLRTYFATLGNKDKASSLIYIAK